MSHTGADTRSAAAAALEDAVAHVLGSNVGGRLPEIARHDRKRGGARVRTVRPPVAPAKPCDDACRPAYVMVAVDAMTALDAVSCRARPAGGRSRPKPRVVPAMSAAGFPEVFWLTPCDGGAGTAPSDGLTLPAGLVAACGDAALVAAQTLTSVTLDGMHIFVVPGGTAMSRAREAVRAVLSAYACAREARLAVFLTSLGSSTECRVLPTDAVWDQERPIAEYVSALAATFDDGASPAVDALGRLLMLRMVALLPPAAEPRADPAAPCAKPAPCRHAAHGRSGCGGRAGAGAAGKDGSGSGVTWEGGVPLKRGPCPPRTLIDAHAPASWAAARAWSPAVLARIHPHQALLVSSMWERLATGTTEALYRAARDACDPADAWAHLLRPLAPLVAPLDDGVRYTLHCLLAYAAAVRTYAAHALSVASELMDDNGSGGGSAGGGGRGSSAGGGSLRAHPGRGAVRGGGREDPFAGVERGDRCVVCGVRARTFGPLRCGHDCLCVECVRDVLSLRGSTSLRCPLCSTLVEAGGAVRDRRRGIK